MAISTRKEEQGVSPKSKHFRDDTVVLAGFKVRGDREALSRFGDIVWDFSPAILAENTRASTHKINFGRLPDPIDRLTAKEYIYARIHRRLMGRARLLSPRSASSEGARVIRFILLIRRKIARLQDATAEDVSSVLTVIGNGRAITPKQLRRRREGKLPTLRALRDAKPFLSYDYLPATALLFRSTASGQDRIPAREEDGFENDTPRIPEEVIGAAFVNAVQYIRIYAKEILAARSTAVAEAARRPSAELRTPLLRIEEWVQRSRDQGRGVPASARALQRGSAKPSKRTIEAETRLGKAYESDEVQAAIHRAIAELGWEVVPSGYGARPGMRIPPGKTSAVEAESRIHAYIADLRKTKRGLPRLCGGAHKRKRGPLRDVHLAFIAAQLSIDQATFNGTNSRGKLLAEALKELGLDDGSADGLLPRKGYALRGWLLEEEERSLIAACYIVIAYLSGMRDSEVQSLRRGCLRVRRSADGLIDRMYLNATLYKGHSEGGVTRSWVVIDPVPEAISILEEMAEARGDDCLFMRPSRRLKYEGNLGSSITPYLAKFCDRVNEWASTRGMPHIPDINGRPWRFTTGQFRRTLAWHIANRPFGIVAGSIQYKHVRIATFEGYAGTSESGFRSEVEAETAIANLGGIWERFQDWERGGAATGPAVQRVHAEFRHVRSQIAAFPGLVSDEKRYRRLLKHLAEAIHPLLLNDCIFDPQHALCLVDVDPSERQVPRVGKCHPTRCPNSYIHRNHLPIWRGAAERADRLSRDKQLPVIRREMMAERAAPLWEVVRSLEGQSHEGR
jgi:integrase